MKEYAFFKGIVLMVYLLLGVGIVGNIWVAPLKVMIYLFPMLVIWAIAGLKGLPKFFKFIDTP